MIFIQSYNFKFFSLNISGISYKFKSLLMFMILLRITLCNVQTRIFKNIINGVSQPQFVIPSTNRNGAHFPRSTHRTEHEGGSREVNERKGGSVSWPNSRHEPRAQSPARLWSITSFTSCPSAWRDPLQDANPVQLFWVLSRGSRTIQHWMCRWCEIGVCF